MNHFICQKIGWYLVPNIKDIQKQVKNCFRLLMAIENSIIEFIWSEYLKHNKHKDQWISTSRNIKTFLENMRKTVTFKIFKIMHVFYLMVRIDKTMARGLSFSFDIYVQYLMFNQINHLEIIVVLLVIKSICDFKTNSINSLFFIHFYITDWNLEAHHSIKIISRMIFN